ncbi:MAG: carbamoyltransferase HypF [Sulfurospirillaceae bacterium]|nr:carbamoyltransferase HypF [Sulfurospirillaceae bacterium]MDD2826266.1 carbamoyltransferase HypF [Sulfurospirillaceae bacterium]
MINSVRWRYHVEGIVQGVGFRPFIYTLCLRFHLKGYVLNNSEGVIIDIEGFENSLNQFEEALHVELPPLARIDLITKDKKLPLQNYTEFTISKSDVSTSKHTLISPDMALCPACLEELKNPNNRRFGYPFINCTHCGPRYSIIKTVPYDRPNTSMHPFVMCHACEQEYTNPLDRRYHAQPISCEACGPTLSLKNIQGDVLATHEKALEIFARFIREGHIVAMKGMGGFHLMCDATCDMTVLELRKRKHRPSKPFAVMFGSLDDVKKECQMQVSEENELCSQLRPIVLLKRHEMLSRISIYIAPRIDRLGAFLPYTPLHVRLFDYLQTPIVATSANRSGEPIITHSDELLEKLDGVVDYYLDYNRDIVNASDDSVIQVIDDKILLMRASRGLAPKSLRFTSHETRKILAVGAQQKNAIAIYHNQQVILSPYIGDLDTVNSFEFFEKTLQSFKDFYDFEPDIIVGDMHPNYATTQWAKKQNKPFVQVQHHYAHILATLYEHRLDEKVLGIAWDGTGYGDDGTIWGGEFLVCDTTSYERVAHFEPFLLLGGDASIKDIRRILISLLFDIGFEHFDEMPFDTKDIKLLKQIYDKKINAPRCSSVGRLFDAVAVLCGLSHKVSYDGESGLLLESLYDNTISEAYSFYLEGTMIHYKHTLLDMIHDKEPRIIATKFMNALVDCVVELSAKYGLPTVLSGGVFQNRTLLENLLVKSKMPLYFPHEIPINDGGICMGQLYKMLSK